MAVVKADAYGHGLVPVHGPRSREVRPGSGWRSSARPSRCVRPASPRPCSPGCSPPGADFGGAIDADIDLTVGSPWSLDAVIARRRASVGRPARIQLKVDTGLGRGGILTDWPEMVERPARGTRPRAPCRSTGIWSHFAYADAPSTRRCSPSRSASSRPCAELERAGVRPPLRHLANSAATLTNPRAHFDLVRPGHRGVRPVAGARPRRDADFGLRRGDDACAARLALVKRAPAGQGVSYGHEYVTDRDTVLGLVPLGYADGIPRSAGNAGRCSSVAGARPSPGGSAWTSSSLDLGPDVAGAAGDEVVVFGAAPTASRLAQDWADAAGTINYEIVTRLGPRVPRVLRRWAGG